MKKRIIKEETTTASIAVPNTMTIGVIDRRKEFPTLQHVYDYYLENVKKDKTGNFVIKYDKNKFSNKDINVLYENFSKFITSSNEKR